MNLFNNSKNPLELSIDKYRDLLMNDINLSIRLTYDEHIYLTKPLAWDDKIITLEPLMKGVDYIPVATDSILDITFLCKNALFCTQIKVIKSYKKQDTLYYITEIVQPLEKKQQREAYRLDVVLDIYYKYFNDIQYESTDTYTSKGLCTNISIGGMCLCTDQQLNVEDTLILHFKFLEEDFEVVGQVLSLGEKTPAQNYSHRIQFIHMNYRKLELLGKLIFEKQRSRLKRPFY